MYGNMGFDSHGTTNDLTYNYSSNSNNLTLYYHHSQDDNHIETEQLYLYFINFYYNEYLFST